MKQELMQLLTNAGTKRQLPAQRILQMSEGSQRYCYLLCSGLIKISSVHPDGRELIKDLVPAGRLFGDQNLYVPGPKNPEIACTLEPSEICQIPVYRMKELMNVHEELRHEVESCLSRRLQKAEERTLSLLWKEVPERILDFLQELALSFGQSTSKGIRIRNFLTHEDMARMTGTSRQSVSSILSQFRKKGWIDYNARQILLYRLPGFSERPIVEMPLSYRQPA